MDDFRSVPDEVRHLLAEIETTKDTLRSISARLAAIEKHVRRAFAVPKPAKKAKRSSEKGSKLTRDQLLSRFDELRSQSKIDTTGDDDRVLKDWAEDDLRALAAELGANTKRMSAVRVRAFVMQKVRESVMLGIDSLRGIQHSTKREADQKGRSNR